MEIRSEERISSAGSIVSSILSFLGGYQVCHSVCLVIVSLLSAIGIIVVGMPLAFLQTVAVPFWIIAFVLLIITLILYHKKKCISRNLLIFNSGVIIAGVPFKIFSNYLFIFWIIGGIIVLISIYLYITGKLRKKR